MNLTTTKEQLLPLLLRALAAADHRNTLPILSHLLIAAEASSLAATGTDLETQIVTQAAIGDGDAWSVAVPGRKLTDIVRMLPDHASITLKLGGERLTVQSGRSRYVLATLPADSYPEFDRAQPQAAAELPAATLLRALTRTRFAAASGDVRYYLNGVLLELDAGTLRTVASDGHRLAVAELPIDGDATSRGVILPIKAVDETIRLLKPHTGGVSLFIANASIMLHIGDTVFAAKRIEGHYPDYRPVLPTRTDLGFRVRTAELLDAARRVCILADEKYYGVAIEMTDEALTLRSGNKEAEEAVEEVALTDFKGDPRRLGYNARYLIDALNTAESEQVELGISDNDAVLITEPDRDPWQTVVMPMRL